MGPGRSVGRTLARLSGVAARRPPDASSDSRRQILAHIQRADVPIGVEELCEATGLHPNTVRGHLEVLLAAGSIHREPARRGSRGRPPLLYRAGPSEMSLHEELLRSLHDQLGNLTDADLIEQAAERWADAVDTGSIASSADAAVDQAAETLQELGFVTQVSPVGDEITIGTCPYLDLVAEHPVICDIHTALLDEVLRRTGQSVSVEEMQVFPKPGICLARLRRDDRDPIRTIRPHA